jgi:hypothetical protein
MTNATEEVKNISLLMSEMSIGAIRDAPHITCAPISCSFQFFLSARVLSFQRLMG